MAPQPSTREVYARIVGASCSGARTRALYAGACAEAAARRDPRAAAIEERMRGIEARLRALELAERQRHILDRIASLDGASGSGNAEGADAGAAAVGVVGAEDTPTQARLRAECARRGMDSARFCRVPEDYYEQDLPYRQKCLGAASVEHLCKTIVMENTKATEADLAIPGYQKYYMVVVQYANKLSTDKLKSWVHSHWQGQIPKKRFNMRLCSAEDNDRLTGFLHNAVAPIGTAEKLPIVLAKNVADLEPNFFWFGGGEVDLKLGCTVEDFMKLENVSVVDIN